MCGFLVFCKICFCFDFTDTCTIRAINSVDTGTSKKCIYLQVWFVRGSTSIFAYSLPLTYGTNSNRATTENGTKRNIFDGGKHQSNKKNNNRWNYTENVFVEKLVFLDHFESPISRRVPSTSHHSVCAFPIVLILSFVALSVFWFLFK